MKLFEHDMIRELKNRISMLEKKLELMEQKIRIQHQTTKANLVHIKNGIPLNDQWLKRELGYYEYSPQVAAELYENPNGQFTIIDVSKSDFYPSFPLENTIKIPLEEITTQIESIKKLHGPLLIISERGLRSILACEQLVKLEVLNLFNVSGGYLFWPSKKVESAA